MPTIDETATILDYIVENPGNPKAIQARQKLGVSDDALQAWQAVKENPDHEKKTQVRNKVFDEVAMAQPAGEVGRFSPGGADAVTRLAVKNLINESPKEIEGYLQRRGFQTRVVDGAFQVKKPGETQFKPLDSEKFDIFDIPDLAGDVIEGIATGFGFLGGSVGGLPGAVAGGAVGAGLAETARQAVGKATGVRREIDPLLVAESAGFGAAGGAIGKIGGEALKATGRGLGKAMAKLAGGATVKPERAEIEAAAERLGLRPTPGQLIDSKTLQEMEEIAFNQRQIFQTAPLRTQKERNKKIVQSVADDILKTNTFIDKEISGVQAKNEIVKVIENRLEKPEAIYSQFEETLGQLPILSSSKGLAAVGEKQAAKNAFEQRGDEIIKRLKGDRKTVNLVRSIIEDSKTLENINDIKVFRTTIGGMIDAQSSPNTKYAARELYKAASDWRKEALVNAAKASGDKELADKAVKILSKADQEYKKVIDDLNTAILPRGKEIKLGPREGLQQFFNKYADSKYIYQTLDTQDTERIKVLRDEFPEAFEIMRDAVIQKMAERSGTPKAILKKVENLPANAKKLLFGEDALQKAEDLRIWINSLPDPKEIGNQSRSGWVARVSKLLTAEKIPFVKQILDELAASEDTFRRNMISDPLLGVDVFSRAGRRVLETKAPVAATQFGFGVQREDERRTNFLNQSPANRFDFGRQ